MLLVQGEHKVFEELKEASLFKKRTEKTSSVCVEVYASVGKEIRAL